MVWLDLFSLVVTLHDIHFREKSVCIGRRVQEVEMMSGLEMIADRHANNVVTVIIIRSGTVNT